MLYKCWTLLYSRQQLYVRQQYLIMWSAQETQLIPMSFGVSKLLCCHNNTFALNKHWVHRSIQKATFINTLQTRINYIYNQTFSRLVCQHEWFIFTEALHLPWNHSDLVQVSAVNCWLDHLVLGRIKRQNVLHLQHSRPVQMWQCCKQRTWVCVNWFRPARQTLLMASWPDWNIYQSDYSLQGHFMVFITTEASVSQTSHAGIAWGNTVKSVRVWRSC